MILSRKWCMPSSDTFSIKPIKQKIQEYINNLPPSSIIVDPFVRNSPFKHLCYSNDLDPDIEANQHMDALDFLKSIKPNSVHLLLFDPPYSPRQVSEVYKKMKRTVNMETTQSSFWSKLKAEIARIMIPGGRVITCRWNSGGIGKTLKFEIVEIMLVPHGGWHNDTIVTIEKYNKN